MVKHRAQVTKVKNRRHGIIAVTKSLTIQKNKNILKAAKKALIKQDKAHKKLMKIIDTSFKHSNVYPIYQKNSCFHMELDLAL